MRWFCADQSGIANHRAGADAQADETPRALVPVESDFTVVLNDDVRKRNRCRHRPQQRNGTLEGVLINANATIRGIYEARINPSLITSDRREAKLTSSTSVWASEEARSAAAPLRA